MRLHRAPPPQDTKTAAAAAAPKADTAEALVDDVVKLLSPVDSDADYTLKRDLVKHQLAHPVLYDKLKAKEKKRVPESLKPLYEKAMVDRIKKFPGNASAVIEKLLAALKTTTKVDYDKEMAGLPTSPSNIKGDIGDVHEYIALRAQFGSLDQITKFYADVSGHSFLGRTPIVHKVMGEKLTKAEAVLTKNKTLDVVKKSVKGIGSLEVRPNVNNPAKFSLHAFGWAIDIDAKLNPNVKDFPAGLIRGVSGVSLFEGSDVAAFQTKPDDRETADELLPEAQALTGASTTFKTAFADEASLKAALIVYLRDRLGATLKDDDFDLDSVKDIIDGRKKVADAQKAVAESKKKKKKKGKGAAADATPSAADLAAAVTTAQEELATAIKTLSDFLAKVMLDPTTAAAEQEEERKEDLINTGGESAVRAEEHKKKKAAEALEKAKKKKGYKAPPEPTDAQKKAAADALAAQTREKAFAFLTHAYEVYLKSFEGTDRVAANPTGTTERIAAHGFLNLAPELIAALTGSDGGGLHWLGATKGTKDFMHFELEPKDQPSKIAGAETEHEEKEAAPAGTATKAEE